MSKRQEFCLALHHLALTFFVICALPLWYLTGILSDVPPDVSADALHAGRYFLDRQSGGLCQF